MTQEEQVTEVTLREQIDKIGRAIQSLPYGEQDDRFYHEEIDALEALIESEKKAAVERALDMMGTFDAYSNWDDDKDTILATLFPPSK